MPPNPAPYVTSISVLVGRENGRVMDGLRRRGVGSELNSEEGGIGDTLTGDGEGCDGEGDTEDMPSAFFCGVVGVVGRLVDLSSPTGATGPASFSVVCSSSRR